MSPTDLLVLFATLAFLVQYVSFRWRGKIALGIVTLLPVAICGWVIWQSWLVESRILATYGSHCNACRVLGTTSCGARAL